MSLLVRYSDIALGAKEAFEITAGASLPSSNLNLLKDDNAEFCRYDVPFDLNSFILDGGAEFLPEEGVAQIGYISEQTSGEDGTFDTPIVFELTADELFTSTGISIVFDEQKSVYASEINLKWYNGNTLLADEDFFPTGANYFCNKKVEFYNKIVITFYALSVPYNRLVVNHIEYGLRVDFGANEISSARVIQEIDPISASVPINPFDFMINSRRNIEFSFQTKQPIEVIFNGETKATTFVKNAKRKTKNTWSIESEDYIGLMDSVFFNGGIYDEKNAVELLDEIFATAKVPYSISNGFGGIALSGYIPYTTCREALMLVVFAMGAVADTSNSDKVNVFALSDDVTQTITKRRIMQGQTFQDATRVTAVELVAHAYKESAETLVAYDAEKSGEGQNVFVLFTEPLHGLTISNGSIVQSGDNYAIINAGAGCTLVGNKYEHTKVIRRQENPLVLATDIENVIKIENATLVSSSNVDKLLTVCYNYLVNTEQVNMKIVDGTGNESEITTVGDFIEYETEFLGNKTGRIIKQSFSLSGGILAKDSIVR